MTENTWISIVVALITGLVVAIYTQWRQDSRHQEVREDSEYCRKSQLVFESQQRQLRAVADFITSIRDLENKRRLEWAVETFDDIDPVEKFGLMMNKNVVFIAKVHVHLDILDLEIIDPVEKRFVGIMRTSLQEDAKVIPDKPMVNPTEDFPDMPMLNGSFESARRELIHLAQERLNPPPPEKFQPFLT